MEYKLKGATVTFNEEGFNDLQNTITDLEKANVELREKLYNYQRFFAEELAEVAEIDPILFISSIEAGTRLKVRIKSYIPHDNMIQKPKHLIDAVKA